MSQANWKKRYFVLNGHSLTYYKDIKAVGAAQGDLLLTGEAWVGSRMLQAIESAALSPPFSLHAPPLERRRRHYCGISPGAKSWPVL